MQEFLKNEQDKYIYYYNDNELEQFYFYQQMPENYNEINLNKKQDFFKRVFREWKLNQINFLLQQITLDIQTYFPERFELASSLTELEIFRCNLNNKELNANSKSIEKDYLNDLNSFKNPNLILYNNINNFTLIQGNNLIKVDEKQNFSNVNNLNSDENKICNRENNKFNTVSINDICNECDEKFSKDCNDSFNQKAFKLPNQEIDFLFFSNRLNSEKLIDYLSNYMHGIEKEMLIYIHEELNKNTYLTNESIYFLINSYKSICNLDTKQKSECIFLYYIFILKILAENKSKFLSSTNYRKLLENQNINHNPTPNSKLCFLNK